MFISDSIKYIGVNDRDIDLFESQYPVPNGVSYNSYVIADEKTAVLDTVDRRKTSEWLDNLALAVQGEPDYLVIQHLEPDHAGSIAAFCEKYKSTVIVSNAKVFAMLPQFFGGLDIDARKLVVKEGDELSLGAHTLCFVTAPMVHWPEVMVTYEKSEKVLFSADAFGKFGALDCGEEWLSEARRYYINIVGKYGAPVTTLLKKASALEIEKILPLHGPALTENLAYYLEKYSVWSSYAPEDSGTLVAYASIHGSTAEAAKALAEKLEAAGEKTELFDLCRCDMSAAVASAFRFIKAVLLASSYDGGMFLPMEDFLIHLRAKTYRSRKVALVQNCAWAPSASKAMKAYLENMQNIELCEKEITIKSSFTDSVSAELNELVSELLK